MSVEHFQLHYMHNYQGLLWTSFLDVFFVCLFVWIQVRVPGMGRGIMEGPGAGKDQKEAIPVTWISKGEALLEEVAS